LKRPRYVVHDFANSYITWRYGSSSPSAAQIAAPQRNRSIFGIINLVRQIQKSAGIEKVHAVVGGWHLAPYPDELIAKTVAAMNEINPDYLIPMHCTGLRTIMAIQREMPEKLIMPSTGTRVVFGG
jgi:metal-dependent hydrolase (beta-lactamase superfamily II)